MAYSGSQFASRLSRLKPAPGWQWPVCGILAFLCLLVAIKLAWLLVGEPAQPAVRFPPVSAPQQMTRISLYPERGGAAAAEQNLSEAAFNASLMGIVHLDGRSLASIAVDGGKEKVYRVGENLTAGVTLERIETTRVVVRERGALRQLTLKSLLNSSAPIEVAESAEWFDSELPPVTATPVLDNGGVAGLRVEQVAAELEAMDLVRKGDVVVAVDGVGLSALMADRDAMDRLADRDALTLTIVRDSGEITVDIDGGLIRSMMGEF